MYDNAVVLMVEEDPHFCSAPLRFGKRTARMPCAASARIRAAASPDGKSDERGPGKMLRGLAATIILSIR